MCAVYVVFAANFAVKVTRLKVKGLRASGDSAQPVPAYMLRAGSMRITGCKCCCAACCGARANVSCLLILFAVAVVVVLLVAAGAVAFVVIIRLLCNTHRYTQTHTRPVPAVASLLSCNISKRRNVAKFQHTWAHVRWLAENWQRRNVNVDDRWQLPNWRRRRRRQV